MFCKYYVADLFTQNIYIQLLQFSIQIQYCLVWQGMKKNAQCKQFIFSVGNIRIRFLDIHGISIIYIYKMLREVWGVGEVSSFCLSPGDKHFSHTAGGGTNNLFVPRGTNISHTQLGGGTNNLFDPRGTNIFLHRGRTNIFSTRGGQTFFYYHDDDRECERSEHSFERSEEAPCRG